MTTSALPTARAAPAFNPWYEIAGAGVAVMEASWLVLVFQSLAESAADASTVLVLLYFALVFTAGAQLMRLLARVRLVENGARLLLLAAYALLTWGGIRLLLPAGETAAFDPFTTRLRGLGEITRLVPAWFWLIPILLWLFLRGVSAGRQGVGIFAVQRYFRLGVGMFLLYAMLAFAAVRDLPGLGVFVVFLFATLLAMAAARVSVLGRLRGGRRSPFTRSWFGSMAAAVTATVAAALTFGMLTTGRFLIFYRQVLTGLLLAVITVTVSPFLFLLGLFAGTPVSTIEAPPPTPALPPWEQDDSILLDYAEGTAEQVALIPEQYRIYYYAALAALGILLIFSLFFGMRTVIRRRGASEGIEVVYQSSDLLDALRKEMERRRNRLRERFFGASRLARRQQILAAARIRRIFSEMMALAETFGTAREPAQTALEFSAALGARMKGSRAEIDGITQAYLKVRYGELPERADEVRDIEAAWERVQAEGADLARAYRQQLDADARERRRRERIQ